MRTDEQTDGCGGVGPVHTPWTGLRQSVFTVCVLALESPVFAFHSRYWNYGRWISDPSVSIGSLSCHSVLGWFITGQLSLSYQRSFVPL